MDRASTLPSRLPKGIVRPQIVAGVNALGRGQDRESLIQFITTISQTMGPEAITQFINPDEYIKRLATAQGIDVLNLVKSISDIQAEMQQQQQDIEVDAPTTPKRKPKQKKTVEKTLRGVRRLQRHRASQQQQMQQRRRE